MFRSFGAPEILIILLVIFLLFGAKRLPDAARGLGRSLRIFKSEVGAMNDDAPADATKAAPSAAKDASDSAAPAPADTAAPTAAPDAER